MKKDYVLAIFVIKRKPLSDQAFLHFCDLGKQWPWQRKSHSNLQASIHLRNSLTPKVLVRVNLRFHRILSVHTDCCYEKFQRKLYTSAQMLISGVRYRDSDTESDYTYIGWDQISTLIPERQSTKAPVTFGDSFDLPRRLIVASQ